MLRNHVGESGRFQLFFVCESNFFFFNFLAEACLLFSGLATLGANPFPFSKLPISGEERERDGEDGGFPLRRNQRRLKDAEGRCCPLRKPARALELRLLRNVCSVPGKVRKLFVGSKEKLQEEALGKTWQKGVGKR